MDALELRRLGREGALPEFEGVQPGDADQISGFTVISGLAVLPVTKVSSSIDRSQDIELFDDANIAMGVLCLTKGKSLKLFEDLTAYRFVAMLTECTEIDLGAAEYVFKSDYAVIDQQKLPLYIEKFLRSAPLWGRFTHSLPHNEGSARAMNSIKALPDIMIPTSHHETIMTRYVYSSNPLERYLKLYHLIELLFDYVYMKRIRSIGDSLEGFSRVMLDYGAKEIVKLQHIIKEYCSDTDGLCRAMCAVKHYGATSEKMFQIYTKDGNPLGDASAWTKFWGLVQQENLTVATVVSSKLAKDSVLARDFIVKLTAYWIYRTRSSIAHSRVGEFLIEESDYDFVTNCAEILLAHVVTQVFSDVKFHQVASS
jgi:hypothetical protein